MSALTLAAPDPGAARDRIESGLDRAALVAAFGRCEVVYDGRASSYLGPGDRLVVLKPDGTLLVHADEQRTPVNWQPPGSEQSAAVEEDSLVVRSVRSNPVEEVEVSFERVDAVVCQDCADDQDLELVGTEADLRERVVTDPDLIEEGFAVEDVEVQTGAGAADIVGRDGADRPTVVELKRRRAGPDAVSQLRRYVDALGRTHEDDDVRGILIAPSATDGARDLLETEGLAFVALAP